MRHHGNRDRGASLVEFALVLPILSLFLFGIVQFGIAYDKQQSINSAAREGARLGALPSTTIAEIEARAIQASGESAASGADPDVLVYGGVSPSTTTAVSSGDGPCASTSPVYDYVRVVVTTPYDITIPFFGVMNVDIDSEAEFRCE